MKEVLLRNYSEKDEESLEILCVKYEGRSAELEQYLEKHFKDIPTKLEVKQTNARAVLEAELKSLQDAGIEEVATMAIEDCPGCRMPQMTFDTTVEMYHCKECNKEFCRVCWQPCLAPDPCQKCLKEEFEIINLLPKREFEEDDPMADEFRKAEAQFLRMQAKGRHTNMEIQSIDIVRNRRLQQKFEAKKAQLAAKEGSDVKSLLLFHGTPQQNVPSILRDNFDLSKVVNGRAHGNGVYFSEQPEVSLSYSMTPANRPMAMSSHFGPSLNLACQALPFNRFKVFLNQPTPSLKSQSGRPAVPLNRSKVFLNQPTKAGRRGRGSWMRIKMRKRPLVLFSARCLWGATSRR